MKKQQKWSGVKLSKEEMKRINRAERAEIIANIVTFLFIMVLGFVALVLVFGMIGGWK